MCNRSASRWSDPVTRRTQRFSVPLSRAVLALIVLGACFWSGCRSSQESAALGVFASKDNTRSAGRRNPNAGSHKQPKVKQSKVKRRSSADGSVKRNSNRILKRKKSAKRKVRSKTGSVRSNDKKNSRPVKIGNKDSISKRPRIRRPTNWEADRRVRARSRVSRAKKRRTSVVRKLFAQRGSCFPPGQLLLRGFKRQRELEVWASCRPKGRLKQITTYEFCYASGSVGPKRRVGDEQVPEGFYTLNYYNPLSLYHLSMKVSYPNRSDRILGGGRGLGGDIMIHGDCVSIGCISLSDERIEELWVMTDAFRDAGKTVHVHLFPSRDLKSMLRSKKHVKHHRFWKNLKQGYDRFERTKLIPKVRVDRRGRYTFH